MDVEIGFRMNVLQVVNGAKHTLKMCLPIFIGKASRKKPSAFQKLAITGTPACTEAPAPKTNTISLTRLIQ